MTNNVTTMKQYSEDLTRVFNLLNLKKVDVSLPKNIVYKTLYDTDCVANYTILDIDFKGIFKVIEDSFKNNPIRSTYFDAIGSFISELEIEPEILFDDEPEFILEDDRLGYFLAENFYRDEEGEQYPKFKKVTRDEFFQKMKEDTQKKNYRITDFRLRNGSFFYQMSDCYNLGKEVY